MLKSLAIVIPVYNEEAIIEFVVTDWHETLSKHAIEFDLHLYNDGSKDQTSEILDRLEKEKTNLVVHHKSNSGHGPTILQGYMENLDYEWIFQTDSDNAMSPSSFPEIWKKRNDFDFLIAKRKNRRQPFSRRVVSQISRITIHSLYGRDVWDVNSPFRLMRTTFFGPEFKKIPKDTFAPNPVISGIAALKKARVIEFEVPFNGRKSGVVSIKKWKLFKAVVKSFLQIFYFRINYFFK